LFLLLGWFVWRRGNWSQEKAFLSRAELAPKRETHGMDLLFFSQQCRCRRFSNNGHAYIFNRFIKSRQVSHTV
jgi:hypothetical protein